MARFPADESSPGACSKERVLSKLGGGGGGLLILPGQNGSKGTDELRCLSLPGLGHDRSVAGGPGESEEPQTYLPREFTGILLCVGVPRGINIARHPKTPWRPMRGGTHLLE